MSGDDSSPDKERLPEDNAPHSPFMKKFEEALDAWSEAATADNVDDAQASGMQLMALVGEEGLRNPRPDVLLMNEADDLESQGRWPEAEAVRRKALALEESAENFGMTAKAQMDLSRLLRQVGRIGEARRYAVAATISARHAKVSLLIVRTLLNEAHCALAAPDADRAVAAASEAVRLIPPGKLLDTTRAGALTDRARCLLASGDPAGAESDLAAAWDFLQANPATISLPGPNWTLANWWETKSRLEQGLGNDFRAREALTLSIEHRRQARGPHARLALARSLETLGEVFKSAGDTAEEERALGEAKSIRKALRLPGES